jgi:hypothetical protein
MKPYDRCWSKTNLKLSHAYGPSYHTSARQLTQKRNHETFIFWAAFLMFQHHQLFMNIESSLGKFKRRSTWHRCEMSETCLSKKKLPDRSMNSFQVPVRIQQYLHRSSSTCHITVFKIPALRDALPQRLLTSKHG